MHKYHLMKFRNCTLIGTHWNQKMESNSDLNREEWVSTARVFTLDTPVSSLPGASSFFHCTECVPRGTVRGGSRYMYVRVRWQPIPKTGKRQKEIITPSPTGNHDTCVYHYAETLKGIRVICGNTWRTRILITNLNASGKCYLWEETWKMFTSSTSCLGLLSGACMGTDVKTTGLSSQLPSSSPTRRETHWFIGPGVHECRSVCVLMYIYIYIDMHTSIYIYIYICVPVCGACESSALSSSSASATAPCVTNDAVAMRRGAKKDKIECAIKNQWLHFFTFTLSTSCSLLLCLLLSQPFEKKIFSPFFWGDTCTDKRGGGA